MSRLKLESIQVLLKVNRVRIESGSKAHESELSRLILHAMPLESELSQGSSELSQSRVRLKNLSRAQPW